MKKQTLASDTKTKENKKRPRISGIHMACDAERKQKGFPEIQQRSSEEQQLRIMCDLLNWYVTELQLNLKLNTALSIPKPGTKSETGHLILRCGPPLV